MKKKSRARHSATFKAKVALEAIKGIKSSSELASGFGVHPSQIAQWKRQLQDGAAEVFAPGVAGDHDRASEALQASLYEQIGKLQMEVDWLKKKLR
jgi:transposase-like protein